MPNLVSLTCLSCQVLDKTQTGKVIYNFWIFSQSLIKPSCHNSRTSDDTDRKITPVTKLEQRNKAAQKKKIVMASVHKLWSHCYFCSLWSRSRIPSAQPVTPKSSLIVTYYPEKSKNRIKKSITQLSYYCFG